MSRQPLALRYRPRRFADVVGQKAARAVLAKICAGRDLPPTLIFSGVRGTGKTSFARIVAKSVNCETPGFEPCLECSSCRMVDAESAPYVVEVDAASHGGVSNMRELITDALYGKGGKWMVFVLDEAHSISEAGFNALLKTLEEPPPQVSFILVTTEPYRIPDTIHARAMMFRFAKITTEDIYQRLFDVAHAEGIAAGEAALRWIAEAANGGMRDALMMLDQVSRLGVAVTVEMLEGVFGVVSAAPLIDALVSGNVARAVVVGDELAAQYGDVGEVVDRALVLLRDALVVRSGRTAASRDVTHVAKTLDVQTITELMRKLWSMRWQMRSLGMDDRAAIAALAAECARAIVREGLTVVEEDEPMVFEEVAGG